MRKTKLVLSAHLPEQFWSFLEQERKETHPTIDIDKFSIDVAVGKPKTYTIDEPDDKCESKSRYVDIEVQTYYTWTLEAKLIKDLEKECNHMINYQWKKSKIKAKIVKRTPKDCVPK